MILKLPTVLKDTVIIGLKKITINCVSFLKLVALEKDDSNLYDYVHC